jgi:hypothetical protein
MAHRITVKDEEEACEYVFYRASEQFIAGPNEISRKIGMMKKVREEIQRELPNAFEIIRIEQLTES